MERTLIIVKPDGVQRGLVGEIIKRFEQRGLRLIGLKLIHMPEALARTHYAVHEGKGFYEGLVQYIISGPVVVMALEGENAIAASRTLIGATRPWEAAAGTIRGDFALTVDFNLVHGSDSPENGLLEVSNFFQEGELLNWTPVLGEWIAR